MSDELRAALAATLDEAREDLRAVLARWPDAEAARGHLEALGGAGSG